MTEATEKKWCVTVSPEHQINISERWLWPRTFETKKFKSQQNIKCPRLLNAFAFRIVFRIDIDNVGLQLKVLLKCLMKCKCWKISNGRNVQNSYECDSGDDDIYKAFVLICMCVMSLVKSHINFIVYSTKR